MSLRFLEDGKGEFAVWKICYLIIGIAIALVLAAIFLGPFFENLGVNIWDDVGNYYKQWMLMSEGKVPYKDFIFEYPPLAIPFIALPGLLCFGGEDLYGVFFTILSTACMVLCYIYLVKIGRNIGLSNKVITLMLVICTFLLTRCFFRLEMIMMLFVIIGFYFYSEKRYALAFSMMALGTMFKLVPAIFAVAMALPFLLRKEWMDLAKYIGLCVVICAVITIPFLIIDSGSAFDYLTYHKARGLQLESVAGSIVLFFNIFTPIAGSEFAYGSTNLTGQIPDAIAGVIMYVMAGVLMTFIVLAAYDHKEELRSDDNLRVVLLIGIISMMIFIAFNKVFSAQYMLWVVPLIGLVLLDRNNQGMRKNILYLTVICMALTILETYPLYPILYEDFNPIAVIVLLARNIVFCVIIWLLIKQKLFDKVTRSYARSSC